MAVVIPLAVGGLIGYGTLRSDVNANMVKLAEKANRETVAEMNTAVLRELAALRFEIGELRREVRAR